MSGIYPGATYQPVSYIADAGPFTAPPLGWILHVVVGNGSPFHTFQSAKSPSRRFSHFWVSNSGTVVQFAPITSKSWAQAGGNATYWSIETEGFPTDPLTPAQIDSLARLHIWLGADDELANRPGNRGIGTHAMGGVGWGAHTCLPLDTTDVLTDQGWIPLRNVTLADRVVSWSPDSGIMDFAEPLSIVAPYRADTVKLHWLESTIDHRFYYRPSLRTPYKVGPASELPRNARIPLAGRLAAPGMPVSDDVLRLLIHTQADGHYAKEGDRRTGLIQFHYKLDRKIERLQGILDRLGVEYATGHPASGATKFTVRDRAWIAVNILPWLPDKRFTWDWLAMDDHQFSIFTEELMLADGCVTRQIYRSKDEINLDVAQALCHLHGRRASRDLHGSGLVLTMSDAVRAKDAHMCFYRKAPEEGRSAVEVGCLTTHNGTLLIRQHGRVAIVGNCPDPVSFAGPRSHQRGDILLRVAQLRNPGNTISRGAPVVHDPLSDADVNAVADGTTGGQARYTVHVPNSKKLVGITEALGGIWQALTDLNATLAPPKK